MSKEFKDYCIRVFSKVHPRATFLSIKGYQNNYNETSDFKVVFHIDYLNAVKRSKEILKKAKYNNHKFSLEDFNLAKKELNDSYDMTLAGNNTLYTCSDVYSNIIGVNNKPIPGIKLHKKQGIVHVNAVKVTKSIIIQGSYPIVKSASKTIAKNYLRNLTPLARWNQFKLSPGRFDRLVVQKMILRNR